MPITRTRTRTRTQPNNHTARPTQLRDTKIDVKVQLSGLWVAMLFLFAYVDIFGFYRSDIIEGALAGEVAGQGITINQAFLAAATGYIVIPSLMVIASLMAPAKLNRRLNISVSIFYAITIAGLCIGETWIYYLLGSFFEVALLLTAVRIAWRWPTTDVNSL
jgi:hypothetical protein